MRIVLQLFLSIFIANATVLTLNTKDTTYNIVPYLSIYIDENNSATIHDIAQGNYHFVKNDKKMLYYHFDDATYWFSFSLQNNTTQKYKITVPTAWLDKVTLFTPTQDANYTQQQSGDRVLRATKSVNNRSIVFNLSPNPGITHYYMRIKSADALKIPMFVVQEDTFQENEDSLNLFFAFLTGVIFMMALYSFFYFLHLKDKVYGIYTGYILSFMVMVLSTHGYFLHYLYVDMFWLNEWIYQISFIGYMGFLIWFTKEFLDVKTFSTPWALFLKYFMLAHLLVVVVSPVLPYPFVMQIGVISGSITPFLLIIPALISRKHNKSWSRFYIVAWSINIVFYTLWALSFFAILPYTMFFNNANSVGVFIELLILSLGMVYRVDAIFKSNRKLSSDVRTDALTNIPNRYAFNTDFPARLNETQKRGKNFYFAMVDIDNFKRYNDTYGHPEGDTVLRKVASLLSSKLTRECDKVYRLGGEEFGIILCTDSLQNASKMVETLRASLEAENIAFHNVALGKLTASFGVVGVNSRSDVNYQHIYKYADEMLYEAKERGRNCVVSKDISKY